MYRALSALLVIAGAVPTAAQQQRGRCFANIGKQEYFGSAEQVRELQRRVRASPARVCPRVGFRFTGGPRSSVVLYDRTTGSIVRVARWMGEAGPRWEYWSGVTDQSILRDDPDDGIDAGQYHEGAGTAALVPASTKRALQRVGG